MASDGGLYAAHHGSCQKSRRTGIRSPFEFTNTLSPEKNFISVWNPEDKAIWIHQQHPLSIKENPSSENRFHELVNVLPSYCTDSENCAVLVGMRMTESLNRALLSRSMKPDTKA